MLLSPHVISKSLTFILGIVFFGKPPLTRMAAKLDQRYPTWHLLLHPSNTILRGIPTNAQLAITILRINEARNAPVPPAPPIDQTPPMKPVPLSFDDLDALTNDKPLGADEGDILDATIPDPAILNEAGGRGSTCEADKGTKPHRLQHLLGHVRRGIKAAVSVAQKADKVRAKAGRQSAKNRVGVLRRESSQLRTSASPLMFRARSQSREGQVHVSADGVISFEDLWNVHVNDITELKKHSGVGLKTKLVISWAMDLDVQDGLEIKDRSGTCYILTAVIQRDQLFDRLCAMGPQRWDVW
jgi:hypothetical protein